MTKSKETERNETREIVKSLKEAFPDILARAWADFFEVKESTFSGWATGTRSIGNDEIKEVALLLLNVLSKSVARDTLHRYIANGSLKWVALSELAQALRLVNLFSRGPLGDLLLGGILVEQSIAI